MTELKIYSLIIRSEDAGLVALTNYGLNGIGEKIGDAKKSAMSVMSGYLIAYMLDGKDFPKPKKQLRSIEDVVNYFSKDIPKDAKVVYDQRRTLKARNGLPALNFEFYKLNQL